jgi:flagellin
MLTIRSNIAAAAARRQLSRSSHDVQGNFAKLSSGYRITQASDDAAGLAVVTNMVAQIRGYQQATRNANDGISVIQTVESALNEGSRLLTRLRELTMQAASDGIGTTERGYLKSEVDNILQELDRISASVEYNSVKVLDGSLTTMSFQVGVRGTTNDYIAVTLKDVGLSSLGLAGSAYSTKFTKTAFAGVFRGLLDKLDTAIETISNFRADLGASANRLMSVMETISVATQTTEAAASRIRDVDVAEESAKLSANQVLVQAGVSVLAQANQAPQAALKLLGG